jgi:hypothetical protein
MEKNRQIWVELNRLLTQTQRHWQNRPFEAMVRQQWRVDHPQLWDWLWSLSEVEHSYFRENDDALAMALSPFIPEAMTLWKLAQTKQLPISENAKIWPRDFEVGIPGRKWQQINAFVSVLPNKEESSQFVEWCAGKGFLGRSLAYQTKLPVISLEWQSELCVVAKKAANQWRLPITVKEGDAFSIDGQSILTSSCHAVALHACGDLHTTLLKAIAKQKSDSVSLSPCCYHLIQTKIYCPLSSLVKTSELQLSPHDLRLCLQESVTAGKRIRDLRFTEVSYRLGFDYLQQQWRDTQEYFSLPNVQKSILMGGFEAFCYWASAEKGLTMPSQINFNAALNEGEKAYREVQCLELIRQLFRRPLEIWLVLDRVLFLEESNYKVNYGTFCSKSMTPRNILILGKKNSQ